MSFRCPWTLLKSSESTGNGNGQPPRPQPWQSGCGRKNEGVQRGIRGADRGGPNTLEIEDSDVTFFARTGPDYVVEMEGFRLEVTMSDGIPQDWVYAASFAASDGCSYVANYSGKVVCFRRRAANGGLRHWYLSEGNSRHGEYAYFSRLPGCTSWRTGRSCSLLGCVSAGPVDGDAVGVWVTVGQEVSVVYAVGQEGRGGTVPGSH